MKSFSSSYAASLFSLAQDENKADALMEELNTFRNILSGNTQYFEILNSPTIALSERLSLIDKAFVGADEYIINFLKLLCEKKCVHLFPDCVNHYERLYNKANNIEKVTVITAFELSSPLKKKLIEKLEQTSSMKIIPEYKIDKSILGGIVLRTENSQTDASVRARLDAVKALLSSAN